MSYELHPLSSLFPRVTGAEFDALVADIKANGLREPIVVHQGLILDGGNRYRACLEAGIEPRFTEFQGGNLVAFVLSANLHRRHLSPGQQAAIVASAQDWALAQTVGNPAFKVQSCNLAPLDTAAGRAAESGASLRTQKMADKVAKEAPELAKRVAHGEISLPEAVEQVTGKRPGAKPAAAAPQPAPQEPEADEDEGEDLHKMLLDMQRECDEAARRLADWERAMAGDGREALLTAIKRYEHAEREKALSDERAAMFQRQRDEYAKRLKAVGRAIGEDDLDKVVRAAQAMARKPVDQEVES